MSAWLLLACTQSAPKDQLEGARRLLDENDLVGARGAYDLVLADHPDEIEALTGRGWALLLLNEGPDARKDFERCRTLAPHEAECLRGIAAVVAATGNVAYAKTLLEQAAALEPGDPKVRSSQALLAVTMGELDTARTLYDGLVAEDPREAGYRLGVAEVALRENRLDEARAVVADAEAQTGVTVRTRGMLALLRARIALADAEARTRTGCAEVAAARKDVDEAIATLDRLLADRTRLPQVEQMRASATGIRNRIDSACPVDGVGTNSDP
jgi:tetratricopeptide (TPR) repeat protein